MMGFGRNYNYTRNEENFAENPCFTTFWAELLFPHHFCPENSFYAEFPPHLRVESASKFHMGKSKQ